MNNEEKRQKLAQHREANKRLLDQDAINDRIALIQRAKEGLVEDRERFYAQIDNINSELEIMDISQRELKAKSSIDDALERSISRHPAGNKLEN